MSPREQCQPDEADWYMEVTYGRDVPGGTETDYNYGYYKGAKPTRPSDLVPPGFKGTRVARRTSREALTLPER